MEDIARAAGLRPVRRRRRRSYAERLALALAPFVLLALAVLLSMGVVRVVERGSIMKTETSFSEDAFYPSEIDFTFDPTLLESDFFFGESAERMGRYDGGEAFSRDTRGAPDLGFSRDTGASTPWPREARSTGSFARP